MVDECSKYSASQLVEITHHQDPWLKAYEQGFNREITKEHMKQYFSDVKEVN